MKLSHEEIVHRISNFRDVLRKSGVKLTHQRLQIFRELARTDDHPDVVTLYNRVKRRVPTISLDTIYRTLWLFADLGIISNVGSSRDKTRFDANIKSHHHFICRKCGMIHDFESDGISEIKIPESVKELGEIERTQIEVTGICRQCSELK